MLRHRRRIIAAVGTAVTAASIVVSGALTASATTRTGIEHFQVMSASATSTRTRVIAYGAFTRAAVDHTGNKVDKFVFANGTFKVAHSPGKGTHSFNPKTCLLQLNLRGTYKIGHGTGAYAGISGHGTYHLSILAIGARSGGKCTQSKPPVAFQQIITASGPVQL